LQDITKCLWSTFVGKHITKATSAQYNPVLLGNRSNIVVAGDENGNVYLWRDLETVKEHVGVNLTGHTSALSKILLTSDDKRMVSIGQSDNCIL
jgi:WD40 repeat protein